MSMVDGMQCEFGEMVEWHWQGTADGRVEEPDTSASLSTTDPHMDWPEIERGRPRWEAGY